MFRDRIDAGQQLANDLKRYKRKKDTVVVALPRGGVVLGYTIANELHLPLDVILVKKIGHPSNPEFAIGAVSMTGMIIDGFTGIDQTYIDKTTQKIQELLKKRYKLYYGDKSPMELKNKTVIVVDDGIATGKTLIAALELIRKEKPEEIIVAVPVAPPDSIKEIENYSDKIICLETYSPFHSIGLYYQDFTQVKDQEVKLLLSIISNNTNPIHNK
jgi:predicted phosphoribosyltransferase